MNWTDRLIYRLMCFPASAYSLICTPSAHWTEQTDEGLTLDARPFTMIRWLPDVFRFKKQGTMKGPKSEMYRWARVSSRGFKRVFRALVPVQCSGCRGTIKAESLFTRGVKGRPVCETCDPMELREERAA